MADLCDEYFEKDYAGGNSGTAANAQRFLAMIKEDIGGLPVRHITSDIIAKKTRLYEMYKTRHTSARNFEGHLKRMFDLAMGPSRRYHPGPNPAAELKIERPNRTTLPVRRKMMPYKEVPAFLELIRGIVTPKTMMVGSQERRVGYQGAFNIPGERTITGFCLEMILLTGARTGELRVAKWEDVDEEELIWATPAEDHKTGKIVGIQYRPITAAMKIVLDQLKARTGSQPYVFPGEGGRPLERSTVGQYVRKVIKPKWTGTPFHIHGFRSTLEAWSTANNYAPALWDYQVFHKVQGVRKHYSQDPQLEPRRKMMEHYGRFCNPPEGNVVNIRSA